MSASMVVADRTVRNSARGAEDYICLVKNLNDGHRAEAVIILTSSLRQFRLDKIEVFCGLQKLVRPMMLQGCCKADRAEVVERDRFATPNSLKSHGEGNLLSPVSNTCAITPKLCMLSRPAHPSKNYYPALKSRTAAKSLATAASPVPHFPRFRALALFGRRPPQRVDSIVMPASENLHSCRSPANRC